WLDSPSVASVAKDSTQIKFIPQQCATLDQLRSFAILWGVADRKRRPRNNAKRSEPAGRNELGVLLADLRVAKGFSLRQVEEAADRAVWNAYLRQLVRGRIQSPS